MVLWLLTLTNLKVLKGVAEKTHSSTIGKSAGSGVDSQNEVSDSGDMNVEEVNNSNTTDNSTAEEVVEETNPLFSTSNILIYIVVFFSRFVRFNNFNEDIF